MGFEMLSKPFQSRAAFSARGKVTSQTLSFSGFENSNPAVHGDEGSRDLSSTSGGPLWSFPISLPKLSLLHLSILLNSKSKVLLDFLTQLFSQRIKARFPLPCPSPKQGCSPSQAHSKGKLGELTALLVELGLGKQHKGKSQFK